MPFVLASACYSASLFAQPASVAFEDSVAVYGPEIFPASLSPTLAAPFGC